MARADLQRLCPSLCETQGPYSRLDPLPPQSLQSNGLAGELAGGDLAWLLVLVQIREKY